MKRVDGKKETPMRRAFSALGRILPPGNKAHAPFVLTREDRATLMSVKLGAGLMRKLSAATIVRSEMVPPDVVTLNTRVSYVDEACGEPTVVTLVAAWSDAWGRKDRLSVHTAIGTALLGTSSGDTVQFGQQRLRVGEVLYQPERARHSALPLAP